MSKRTILVIGSSNTDMTVKTKALPLPGETVLGGVFTMGAGGKGANQAVAARRLGGDVKFICKVGRDIFGDNALAHYAEEGLDTSGVLRSDLPSGVALISVDEKAENCIVVASGANNDLLEADIEASKEAIEACGILLLQLETPVPSVLKAAKMAHEAGATVVLNPAPACPLPDELFPFVDLFIPNETELASFSGMPVGDAGQAAAAAGEMQRKGVGKLIVTMGSKGSLICDGGEPVFVPAKKVKAVDTTAAGDTFCGALCVALSEGKGLKEAAEFATAASALTVQKMGAQNSIPFRKDLTI
ncbi:MAG: ribokinase [Bacteroidales bacterium]|nr:ribokinase [Bacteroidales bacterium]